MADTALNEMAAAFGAGCLDKKNLTHFKDYLGRGGKLPGKELGEVQNIVSLIPLILDEEKPDPKVKDAVAKKLLSYQNEIKAKIRERKEQGITNKTVATPERKKFDPSRKTQVEAEKTEAPTRIPKEEEVLDEILNSTSEIKSETKVTEVKPAQTEVPQTEERQTKQTTVPTQNVTNVESPKSPEEIYEQRSEGNREPQHIHQEVRTVYETKIPMWIWAVVAGVIFAGAFVSFIIYQNTGVVEEKLFSANTEITALKDQLANKENEIYTNQILIDFLNKDDIDFIKFVPTDLAMDARGKIFLSFDSGEGLLELSDLPPIEAGKVYHLWIISLSQSYTVLEFLPDPNLKFIKIPKLPYVPREEIDLIRITVEDQSSADMPRGSTYLYGALQSK